MTIVTPSMSDDATDHPALERLIRYQLDNGVGFLCILAIISETPRLALDEENKIIKLAKEENEGLAPILEHCGSDNTT